MSTINRYACQEDFDKIKSQMRTTIQTAFYQNNVENVKTVVYAYERARQSPGIIELTGIPVYEAEKQGLPENAHALLFNDGNTFGSAAAAGKKVEPKHTLDTIEAIVDGKADFKQWVLLKSWKS